MDQVFFERIIVVGLCLNFEFEMMKLANLNNHKVNLKRFNEFVKFNKFISMNKLSDNVFGRDLSFTI